MAGRATDVRQAGAAILMLTIVVHSGCDRPSADPDPGIPLPIAEARQRAIQDLRYQLSLDIPETMTEPIGGTVAIRFTATDVSHPAVLDFDAGPNHLTSVRVGGQPSRYQEVNEHIVIPAGELTRGENTIEIAFRAGEAPLNRNPEFLYTIFVPARAHQAFPCFDQPDLKARFTLELTVPSNWQAVANGAETARQDIGGNRVRLRYAETQPIPTYLFAFAAGRFQIETALREGRAFRMFHRETDAKKVARNRDAVFDLHASALHWLEDYTAIPYQFGKFDFVLVPSFQFGGMEHAGAIFYNAASILLDESATQNQILARAELIAHETSHMWFGDLVTMRWFNDVWMKEVFANFMAAKIVNPSFPKVNHELRFLVSNYPAAYGVDRTAGTHPIRQELGNLNEAGSLYGAIIYQKAPIIMRQLERLLGPEGLRDGLRAYLKQFEFGNATWLELIRVLDERTDRDLAAWSRVWVEEAGRPAIRTELETDTAGRLRRLSFVQRDPQEGRSLRWTQQIDVLLGTLQGTRTVPIELRDERTDVPGVDAVDAQGAPGGLRFVLPTGGGLAYGGFELDAASRSYLIGHVEELSDPVARGAAWITLWDEMLEGRAKPADLLSAALRGLPREDTEQNVQLIAGYLSDLFWRFSSDGERRTIAATLEQTLRAGLTRAQTSSLKSTYFSAFRSTMTTPAGVAFLERVWKRQEKIPGLVLAEPDEATMALELAVRAVPNTSAILDEQRMRFANPDRKARFEFVMPALSGDPATRDRFFDSLANVANRRREPWVTEGLSYLNHPLRADESRKHLRASLDLLREIQRTGDIFFPRNWLNAVLSGHHSREAAAIVRTFLAGQPDYPVRLRRIILQSADTLLRSSAGR